MNPKARQSITASLLCLAFIFAFAWAVVAIRGEGAARWEPIPWIGGSVVVAWICIKKWHIDKPSPTPPPEAHTEKQP